MTRHKKRVQVVDRLVILLIIYTSFSNSVKSGQWAGHGSGTLAFGFVGSALLLALALLATAYAADAARLDAGGRITAMFCGSQKSLALGAGMAKMIFGAHPGMGLILLPIMIYHPMQLVACGVLAQRWGAREAGRTR
jgi:solute carrier family 10 (sodium/bile acid cotransporter), member 7